MNENLKVCLETLYDKFINFYTKNIVEIFQREFSEENVDYIPKTPTFEDFTIRILNTIRVFDVDGESIILCNEDTGYNQGYNCLCNIEDVENETSYSFEEAFNHIEFSNVFECFNLIEYLQTIIVHFPEVTITNEKGESTKIKHLFARVKFYLDGKITSEGFKLNRSHYSYNHFINNYMHSHVHNIDKPYGYFQECCRGTGPINTSIAALKYDYSEAQWMQFCWDLAKYVTIESLEGVPYHKLIDADKSPYKGDTFNTLIIDTSNTLRNLFYSDDGLLHVDYFWENFVEYLIENKVLNFTWCNSQWVISDNYINCIKAVTEAFLNFYKQNISNLLNNPETNYKVNDLIDFNILQKVIIDPTGIYKYKTILNPDVDIYRGNYILNFKGVDYYLEIDEPTNDDRCNVILNIKIYSKIIHSILTILNLNYNERNIIETTESEI